MSSPGLFAATSYVTYGITWLAILAAVGMLFVVLQPQIAAGMNLPGSKGSLMLILGGIAGIVMVLALLTTLGFIFVSFGLPDILYLVAIAAAVVMAWTGWQAFQAEGGKLQIGTSGGGASPAAAPTPPEPSSAPAPESGSVASASASAPAAPPVADPGQPAPDRDPDA